MAGHVIPEVHVDLLAAVPNGHLVKYMPRSAAITKTHLELGYEHLVEQKTSRLGVYLDELACKRYCNWQWGLPCQAAFIDVGEDSRPITTPEPREPRTAF